MWEEHLLRVLIFSQDGGGETKRETRSEKVRDLRENGLEEITVSPLSCSPVGLAHKHTGSMKNFKCKP